ncbi:MAG: shikimate kinase [Alphaproteobacteria bacterium]|nr:shikimate kinase [Alphaproteobacteria bacterium]
MSENSENLSTSSVPSRPTSPLVSLMPPKPVVLVGLMGCGKTSIGKRLAKRFDLPFVDSDQEVELAAGCSVNDIDSIFGEGSLEAGEYKVISRLLSQSTQVIATGCFSFTFENTRALIKEKAISVWLNADLQTLFMRITGRKDRPLLEPGREEEILKKMMDDHYPFFNQADVCIKTYDEPANVTVDRVIIAMSDFIKANYPDYHVLKSV